MYTEALVVCTRFLTFLQHLVTWCQPHESNQTSKQFEFHLLIDSHHWHYADQILQITVQEMRWF